MLQLRDGVARFDLEDADRILRHKWSSVRMGSRVYAITRIAGRTTYMHRLILDAPGDVDHRNMDGLDNRRSNLREATRSQNMANSRSRGGSSQYKGVGWHKAAGKWKAAICIEGKSVHLGLFADEKDAALAYDRAASYAWGEYARLNFEG